MPADFLANDFGAIARAMRQESPPPPTAVLHFWDMSGLVTSTHENIEAAVEGAYVLVASDMGIPVRITAIDGTVLMNTAALAEAVIRYREGMRT
jgi:hypothetical protein